MRVKKQQMSAKLDMFANFEGGAHSDEINYSMLKLLIIALLIVGFYTESEPY